MIPWSLFWRKFIYVIYEGIITYQGQYLLIIKSPDPLSSETE